MLWYSQTRTIIITVIDSLDRHHPLKRSMTAERHLSLTSSKSYRKFTVSTLYVLGVATVV